MHPEDIEYLKCHCSICFLEADGRKYATGNNLICHRCYDILSDETKRLFSSPSLEQVMKDIDKWSEDHPDEYHPALFLKRHKERNEKLLKQLENNRIK